MLGFHWATLLKPKTHNIVKTKQLFTILTCIVSLCSSTLLTANADESKKKWNPIRTKTGTEISTPEEGFYLIAVIDKNTGEIVDDVSGYFPADSSIPVPSTTNNEVVLIQKVPIPSGNTIPNEFADSF